MDHATRYAREKVHWESPAVVGFAALAVVLDQLPANSTAAHGLQLGVLCATAAFAVWMIAIRHAYQSVYVVLVQCLAIKLPSSCAQASSTSNSSVL
jgi:hypothetical protein